jgi:hypothetical protein
MRFLSATDGERRVGCRDCPKAIQFGSAKLGRAQGLAAATAADRAGVERHRVVTRADQKMSGQISHRSQSLVAEARGARPSWPRLPEKYIFIGLKSAMLD